MKNYHATVNNNQSALIERLRYRQKPRRRHLPSQPICLSAPGSFARLGGTASAPTTTGASHPTKTPICPTSGHLRRHSPRPNFSPQCRSPTNHSLITYSLLLCLFSLFPQLHPPHYTTDPSQKPQRWATTRLTPWRLTPSALSRYVYRDNLNGWAASPSLSHRHQTAY
jgi:hypothetical protein